MPLYGSRPHVSESVLRDSISHVGYRDLQPTAGYDTFQMYV